MIKLYNNTVIKIHLDDIALLSYPIAYETLKFFYLNRYESYKIKNVESELTSFNREELTKVVSEFFEKKWLLDIGNYTRKIELEENENIEKSYMLSYRGKFVMEKVLNGN